MLVQKRHGFHAVGWESWVEWERQSDSIILAKESLPSAEVGAEGAPQIDTLKIVGDYSSSVLTVHRQEQTQHEQGQHTSSKPRHKPLQFIRILQI